MLSAKRFDRADNARCDIKSKAKIPSRVCLILPRLNRNVDTFLSKYLYREFILTFIVSNSYLFQWYSVFAIFSYRIISNYSLSIRSRFNSFL